MNKINLSVKGNETAKAAYEKPAMCVYELEIEGAILQASTGDASPSDYGYDNLGGWE